MDTDPLTATEEQPAPGGLGINGREMALLSLWIYAMAFVTTLTVLAIIAHTVTKRHNEES